VRCRRGRIRGRHDGPSRGAAIGPGPLDQLGFVAVAGMVSLGFRGSLKRVNGSGDLVDLMGRASASFRTFSGEFRVVAHRAVQDRALEAAARRERTDQSGAGEHTTRFSFRIDLGPHDTDSGEPVVTPLQVSLERPDRYREQAGQGSGLTVVVRDGPRWWAYDPGIGVHGSDDGSGWTAGGPYEVLFDPVDSVSRLELERLGTGRWAGRSVVRVRGRVGPGVDVATEEALLGLGEGADEYEFAIDAEHGVILRAEARFAGASLELVEAIKVSFDEELPPDTFVFAAPGTA
jgi:outer membrane lipoprotein-sorting protein